MALALCKRGIRYRTASQLNVLFTLEPNIPTSGAALAAAADATSSSAFCSMWMMCKDSNSMSTIGYSFSPLHPSKDHRHQKHIRAQFGTEILRQSQVPTGCREGPSYLCFLRFHFFGGPVRRMSTETKAQKKIKKKKKKKKTKRGLVKKLKRIRYVAAIKKKNMDHEQKLMARIERAKKMIDQLKGLLKKYELPPLPIPEHDPESLTAEELHYLKRLGYKHRNYLIIGVRGVFGGVIQNMHLHWKKHQLVKVRCKNFTEDEIRETGEQLARLSGGIVVDVQQGHTIVMYRGKNYTRPVDIIPKNTLTKRKALFKARYEQSLESFTKNLEALENELKLYREYKAREAAGLLTQGEVYREPDVPVASFASTWSDSEDVEVDPALVCDSDSVLESDSGSGSDADTELASHAVLKANADSNSYSDLSHSDADSGSSVTMDSDSDLESHSVDAGSARS